METNSDNISSIELLKIAHGLVKSKSSVSKMNQHQRNLIKWAKNVDKRYAWVVLGSMWIVLAASFGTYRVYGLVYAKVVAEGVYSRKEASWPVSMIGSVENTVGPLVSIIIYYTSFRTSMFLGGILLAIGNGAAYWSESLILDIILLGIVQGFGFALLFVPQMEVINNYFVRYRNLALGFALCGGTISVFGWVPIYRYVLANYHWRTAYLVTSSISCLIVLVVPLLKPNQRPAVPMIEVNKPIVGQLGHNPNKTCIEKSCNTDQSDLNRLGDNQVNNSNCQYEQITIQNETKVVQQQECPISLDIAGENNSKTPFTMSTIWKILKTPGFHLVWYLELISFTVGGTYSLIVIDYGIDRGCNEIEAHNLLHFRSIGEIIGRLLLTSLVDQRFLSNRNTVILVLFILAGLLFINTIVIGMFWFSILALSISAVSSLIYILLNGLLVDFLGEHNVTIGYGLASSVVGLLLMMRPQLVGYFRDTVGSYDQLMICFGMGCIFGAVFFIIEPLASRLCIKK